MDWLLFLELAFVTVAVGLSIYRIIVSIAESRLFPIILKAIEEAEDQDGLKGDEKLNYALDYIKREATARGITVDLTKTIKLIERLVSLTKKVNFK